MHYASLDALRVAGLPGTGPIAIVLAEDEVELASTLAHNDAIGFKTQILMAHPQLAYTGSLSGQIIRVDHPVSAPGAVETAVNGVIRIAQDRWVFYGFNAEYLFYPFFENRTVGEMLTFHAQERRDAMLSYVIDLYAGDLEAHPNAVSREGTYLDRSGYYGIPRHDPKDGSVPLDRQMDFYGGLRWRFEEHVPKPRRRIDRISLFRAKKGLWLQPDHTFNDPEYNTYACPWHNNLTAAVCSFRAAKALRGNAGSRKDVDTFLWHNSVPFDWTSDQLLKLGLIEPGQWF